MDRCMSEAWGPLYAIVYYHTMTENIDETQRTEKTERLERIERIEQTERTERTHSNVITITITEIGLSYYFHIRDHQWRLQCMVLR